MQNTNTSNTTGQYANITLQIAPTLGIGAGGRVLGDIRLVRTTTNSNAFFLFSAFRSDGAYRDYLRLDFTGATFSGDINATNVTSSGGVYAAGASGFYSTTFVSNSRNPIWRFANADTYGLSYFQGNAGVSNLDTIGFHFGTATSAGSIFRFNQSGTAEFAAHINPQSNAIYNLGSSSLRWNVVFSSDLSLKNEYGDYTIVEGEEKLYLYNNKNNKVYSFVLNEEDPATAPPKKIE
jgi:hypothetical protein